MLLDKCPGAARNCVRPCIWLRTRRGRGVASAHRPPDKRNGQTPHGRSLAHSAPARVVHEVKANLLVQLLGPAQDRPLPQSLAQNAHKAFPAAAHPLTEPQEGGVTQTKRRRGFGCSERYTSTAWRS